MSATIAEPISKRMTPEEFAEKYDGQRVEYRNGRVVELPMSEFLHGRLCYRIAILIGLCLEQHDIGIGATNDTWLKLPMPGDPTNVRGPDFFFVSYARLPKGYKIRGYIPKNPELVIEAKSQHDTWPEVREMVVEYLANDVLTVVVFDPAKESASVFTSQGEKKLSSSDMLELPGILPGFAVPVAKFFA